MWKKFNDVNLYDDHVNIILSLLQCVTLAEEKNEKREGKVNVCFLKAEKQIYQDADDRGEKNFIRLIHSLLALLFEILCLLFLVILLLLLLLRFSRAILFLRACARVHTEPSWIVRWLAKINSIPPYI